MLIIETVQLVSVVYLDGLRLSDQQSKQHKLLSLTTPALTAAGLYSNLKDAAILVRILPIQSIRDNLSCPKLPGVRGCWRRIVSVVLLLNIGVKHNTVTKTGTHSG